MDNRYDKISKEEEVSVEWKEQYQVQSKATRQSKIEEIIMHLEGSM